jgi:hypothetical protein
MKDKESLLLIEAVEKLYQVFSTYPLNLEMDHCPHCVFFEDIERITNRPLRELSAQDLEEYSRKAMTTWGDNRDFRHFLPRLFELLPHPSEALLDPETIFGKLNYGEWSEWPEEERKAIIEYCDKLWRYVLSSRGPIDPVEDYLRGIAQVIDDLEPYLIYWQESIQKLPLLRLEWLIQEYLNYGSTPQIVSWLTSQNTLRYFQEKALTAKRNKKIIGEIVIKLKQLQKVEPEIEPNLFYYESKGPF